MLNVQKKFENCNSGVYGKKQYDTVKFLSFSQGTVCLCTHFISIQKF